MRDLWGLIAKTSLARVYSMLVGVAILALTARLLGPEGRGKIAVVTTWSVLFANIGYLSLGEVLVYRAGQESNDHWFTESFSSLVVIFLTISLLTVAAIVAIYFIDPAIFRGVSGWIFGCLCLLTATKIWGQYNGVLLSAFEKLTIYNRYLIYSQTMALSLIIIFVWWFKLGVVSALFSMIVGQVVLASSGLKYFWQKARKTVRYSKGEITYLLKGGMKLHINAIGSYLFLSADVLMINYFLGTKDAGFYQLATQLLSVMMIVSQSASMVLFGKVTSLGTADAWRVQRKLLLVIIALMICVGLLAWMLAPYFIPVLAGEKFRPSVKIFDYLLFAIVGMTFVNVMASQWIGRGLFVQASAITLFVGLANVYANYILIPKYGVMGAVWATLGTYTFAVVGNGILALICEVEYQKSKGMHT